MSAKDNAPPSMDVFLKGLWQENPVFVMLLGMCPVLAVTNKVINCVAMGLSALFVLTMSSLLISLLRNLIPKQVRIASFIIIIATFVTVVDYVIPTISLDLYDSLGAFIQLIVVNCIILGRAEAFAINNPVRHSVLDALGVGMGYGFSLMVLSLMREWSGFGTLFGLRALPEAVTPAALMSIPPGAFFALGTYILVVTAIRNRRKGR